MPGRPPLSDLAVFQGCKSWVGTDRPELPDDGESPIKAVTVSRFSIDRCAVSVDRFTEFTRATGYRTDAERLGWSFVFRGLIADLDKVDIIGSANKLGWWLGVAGASWRFPQGPTGPAAQSNLPATHISWNDAHAFATWVGGRLPTEAEWEHAARGGLRNIRYPWGDAEPDDETIFCNIWQGQFPEHNTCADGHYGPAPVKSFQPSDAGLYNMSGNTWEWTSDRFRIRSLKGAARRRNQEAFEQNEMVLKGGSFLCHASYCWRYLIAARTGRAPDTGASHTGFRIAYSEPELNHAL
jgi:formylglycine-generating enzyme required for sulfatase activity